MSTSQDKTKLWWQAGSLLLVIGLLMTYIIFEERKPLGPEELKIQVAELRSFAAEGRLIAEQARDQRLTETYFQAQTAMLADKSASALKSLNSSASKQGFELPFFRVKELAGKIDGELKTLASASGNAAALERVGTNLEKIYPQLSALEDGFAQARN